jgi:DNA-binding NarL/FixJ family response regulator
MDDAADGAVDVELSERGLRLLVVDDHELVLLGTRLLLARLEWVERCLQARDCEQALTLARRHRPHVAVVDLFIGPHSGLSLCAALHGAMPCIRVLLMSGVGEVSERRALAAGASGFVSKDAGARALIDAIRALHDGGTHFSTRPSAAPLPGGLTVRELEVLRLIAVGATNRQIAGQLHLSPDTVKQHASGLYRKLAASNRAAAVHRAQQLGLVG